MYTPLFCLEIGGRIEIGYAEAVQIGDDPSRLFERELFIELYSVR
jgi:hypothetical protein